MLVAKYADSLPLYRQAEIYARAGVDLDRSTLAGWVGATSELLTPLIDRVRDHVLAATKLHADDTPVPVLPPQRHGPVAGDPGARARHWQDQDRAALDLCPR